MGEVKAFSPTGSEISGPIKKYEILDAVPVTEKPDTRRIAGTALIIFLVGLGGFGYWCATADVSSAAMTHGTIKVDSNRKTIQHLEGGIISQILVKEGDTVQAGQPLVVLDRTENKANYDVMFVQHLTLSVREARLTAERHQKPSFQLPRDAEANMGIPEVADAVNTQRNIFESRKKAISTQFDILNSRIDQYKAQIAASESQRESLRRQMSFIKEEMAGVKSLLDKGLERKPRFLELQRNAAALDGSMGEYAGRISQAKEMIAGAQLEIVGIVDERLSQIESELAEVQQKVADIKSVIPAQEAKVNRAVITSPQEGTVLNMQYFTVGGVVPPGGPLMDIVPSGDKLVVETMVSPMDIDSVKTGMEADVVLSALNHRTTPHLKGEVSNVSADTLTDKATGKTYFTAKVEISKDEIARLQGAKLYPGMPAEVAIITGQRTPFEYFAAPIKESFWKSFREQ